MGLQPDAIVALVEEQGAGAGPGRRTRHELIGEIIDEGAVIAGRQDRDAFGERLATSGRSCGPSVAPGSRSRRAR
jgi:hypothetical protein